MRTIQPDYAHTTLVTKHRSIVYLSDHGRLSLRKEHGRFNVRVELFNNHHIIRSDFATLTGALINAEAYLKGIL